MKKFAAYIGPEWIIILLWLAALVTPYVLPPSAALIPLIFPAAFGFMFAVTLALGRFKRVHMARRMGHAPKEIQGDMRSGFVTVETFDGKLHSVEIPEEMRDEDPQKLARYVVSQFAPELVPEMWPDGDGD